MSENMRPAEAGNSEAADEQQTEEVGASDVMRGDAVHADEDVRGPDLEQRAGGEAGLPAGTPAVQERAFGARGGRGRGYGSCRDEG